MSDSKKEIQTWTGIQTPGPPNIQPGALTVELPWLSISPTNCL